MRDHVFWLIDQAVSLEPVRWARICGRLLDIYIWWAEGVHLRPQPVTSRGQRNWSRLLTEEMLINALPFDPGVLAEPMRSVTLDAHLGDALMQMTAFLHTRVGAQGVPLEQASGLRAKYRVATKRSQKFVPGGGAFFKSLCARINAAGWRPDGEFPMRAFLQGCYFNSERLIQTNWYGAELSEAVFDESLTSLNVFLEANLEAASFVNTSLFGTLFGSARLTRADMRGADCKRAYLGNANLEQAVLANAKLDAADLSGANCKRSLMTDAHLEGADLSDANLEGADMRGAELKGAKIKGANLDGVKFEGARSASVLRRAAAGAKPKKK